MGFEFQCGVCGSIIEADDDHRGEEIPCPSCGREIIVPLSNLAVGNIFAGYRIEERIGMGTFGEVFRATQMKRNEQVALKILPAGGSSRQQEAAERFLNEVHMMARLTHPNVVVAKEAGGANGYYFLAMDFVDGYDLMQRLENQGPLTEKEAMEISLKLIDALAYAWDSFKMTHRDIKPDNVMINKTDGAVKLMDLGLSKSLYDESDVLLSTGSVIGTPFYMSPEQIRGEELDWRSDQYSLGATMYHLLAGSPPFDGETCEELLENVLNEEWRSPCFFDPSISSACESLLKHLMRRDKQERYQSWQDVKEAFEQVLLGQQPPAPVKQGRMTSMAGIPTSRIRNAARLQVKTETERQLSESGVLMTPSQVETEDTLVMELPTQLVDDKGGESNTRRVVVVGAVAIGMTLIVVLLIALVIMSN